MNVLPFVRRYSEAKALWDTLVRLYGARNGIAMAGGPTINRLAPMEEKVVGGAGDRVYGAGKEKCVVGFARKRAKGRAGEEGRKVTGGGSLGKENRKR
jgi:hypothetical protein